MACSIPGNVSLCRTWLNLAKEKGLTIHSLNSDCLLCQNYARLGGRLCARMEDTVLACKQRQARLQRVGKQWALIVPSYACVTLWNFGLWTEKFLSEIKSD